MELCKFWDDFITTNRSSLRDFFKLLTDHDNNTTIHCGELNVSAHG
jgi:hypothetical protein